MWTRIVDHHATLKKVPDKAPERLIMVNKSALAFTAFQ